MKKYENKNYQIFFEKYTKPTHQSECLGHEKVLSGSKFPEETSKGVSKNKQRCHKQLSQVRQDLCLQKNEFDF